MGSATREAVARLKNVLSQPDIAASVAVAAELFAASRSVSSSAQLRSLLADSAIESAQKAGIMPRVFGASLRPLTEQILSCAVAQRWSTPDDLTSGIEESALRVLAMTLDDPDSLQSELLSCGEIVSSDPQLELTLGSKLGSPQAKTAMVSALFQAKTSEQAFLVLSHIVQQNRSKRFAERLQHAAMIIADQSDRVLATVVTARPLVSEQLKRLRASLSKIYGREVTLTQQVDHSVLGGLRIHIGDDVIDGSIENKINQLRLAVVG